MRTAHTLYSRVVYLHDWRIFLYIWEAMNAPIQQQQKSID